MISSKRLAVDSMYSGEIGPGVHLLYQGKEEDSGRVYYILPELNSTIQNTIGDLIVDIQQFQAGRLNPRSPLVSTVNEISTMVYNAAFGKGRWTLSREGLFTPFEWAVYRDSIGKSTEEF